jgi:hypothetical protein
MGTAEAAVPIEHIWLGPWPSAPNHGRRVLVHLTVRGLARLQHE